MAKVQTTRILSNIDEYLAIAGSDRNHLVSATVWLRDIGEIDGMNRAWQAWLPEGCAPARATVQALLGGPHYRVEIALVAQLRG